MKLMTNVKTFCTVHSAELLLGAGVAGAIGTVASTAYATVKISGEIDELNTIISEIDASTEEGKTVVRKIRLKHAGKMALYALPAVGCFSMSMGGFFGAYKVIDSKLAAMTATASAFEAMLTEYRARVVADQGESKDEYYMTGVKKAKDGTVSVVNEETGEVTDVSVKTSKTEPKFVDDEFCFLFDETTTPAWDYRMPQLNLYSVKACEEDLNRLFEFQPYIHLNDCLGMLGLDKTDIGRVVGWKRESLHDGHDPIKLEIWNPKTHTKINENDVDGTEGFWVRPNVDGIIYID